MECVIKPSGPGPPEVRYNTTLPVVGTEELLSSTKMEAVLPHPLSASTPECLPKSKQTTKKRKLEQLENGSVNDSPTRKSKSSRISAQDSISNGQDSGHFWTPACLEESKKLWSPTKTVCADSDSTSWSGSLKSTTLKSWPCIQKTQILLNASQKISWQSSLSLQLGSTVCALTKKQLGKYSTEVQVEKVSKVSEKKKSISVEERKAQQQANRQKRLERQKLREMKTQEKLTHNWQKDEKIMRQGFTTNQLQTYNSLVTDQKKIEFWSGWKKWHNWWIGIKTVQLPFVDDEAAKKEILDNCENRKLVSKLLRPFQDQARKKFEASLDPEARSLYVQKPKKNQNADFRAWQSPNPTPSINNTRKVKCKSHDLLYTQSLQTVPESIRRLQTVEIKPEPSVCKYVRKIPIYPTTTQKKHLRNYLDAYRFTYNATVALHNDKEKCLEIFDVRNPPATDLAKHVVDSTLEKNPWLKNTPRNLRYEAPREFDKALKLARELQHGGRFQMKFKSLKRSSSLSVPLGQRCVFIDNKGVKIFPTANGCGQIKHQAQASLVSALYKQASAKRPEETKVGKNGFKPAYECKLVYHRFTGKFFLHFVLERPKKWAKPMAPPSENQAGARIIALDPGVRTFLTGYSPSGEVVEIAPSSGGKGIQRLCRIAGGVDKIRSKLSDSLSGAKKRRLKRALHRQNGKIRNLVDEIHWQTASYLCKNYDLILLPEFGSQKMVRKRNERGLWSRKISKNTSRRMMMLSHYKFRSRLLQKAGEYGRKVNIVSEAFTSKTCSSCGYINRQLGSSKTFSCSSCLGCFDRDLNAAKNILLRNICPSGGIAG